MTAAICHIHRFLFVSDNALHSIITIVLIRHRYSLYFLCLLLQMSLSTRYTAHITAG